MKKLIRMLRYTRVKFVRSSRRTKTVVITMIAVCLVSLLTLNLTINAINAKAEAARKEAARLEYENSQLEDKVDGLGSAGSVEDIAQGELGMVPGDSVVIQPGQ